MRYVFIILAVLLAGNAATAQEDSSFRLIRSYQGDITAAAMDNLDNLYLISSTGQIKKYNASGDSAGVYNQVRNFGKLTSIDVSNPLKLLLFYKDFSTVVVLDRFLATIATIDLRKFSMLQPAAIGLSYDNHILVYDEYDHKLKKIDEQGNPLMETPDFRQVFEESISPQKIISHNGSVYLADSASGVFVFDNYGTFKRKLPLKGWQTVAVVNNNLVSITGNTLSVFYPAVQLERTQTLPFFKPYHHAFIHADKFVLAGPGGLEVYQYRF